jgi:hypothetical protein
MAAGADEVARCKVLGNHIIHALATAVNAHVNAKKVEPELGQPATASTFGEFCSCGQFVKSSAITRYCAFSAI